MPLWIWINTLVFPIGMTCRVSLSNFSIVCVPCTLSLIPLSATLWALLQGASSSLKCKLTPLILNIMWYKTTKHFHIAFNWHPSCSDNWEISVESSTDILWSAPLAVEDTMFRISSFNSSLASSKRVSHSSLTAALAASSANWRRDSERQKRLPEQQSMNYGKHVLSWLQMKGRRGCLSNSCTDCVVAWSLASASCDSWRSVNFLWSSKAAVTERKLEANESKVLNSAPSSCAYIVLLWELRHLILCAHLPSADPRGTVPVSAHANGSAHNLFLHKCWTAHNHLDARSPVRMWFQPIVYLALDCLEKLLCRHQPSQCRNSMALRAARGKYQPVVAHLHFLISLCSVPIKGAKEVLEGSPPGGCNGKVADAVVAENY